MRKQASRPVSTESLRGDLRQAWRHLRRAPAFAATVVLVLAFFGGAALLLSAFSIYGLISFVAAGRVREIGIRMALGASRASVVRLFVFQGIRLTIIGAIIGLLASALAGRLLSALFFRVRALDARTLLLAVAILGAVAAIAALIPAWRSSRVEPVDALRTE